MRERLKLFGDQMDGDITHIDETIAHIRTLKKQVALLATPQSSAPVVGDELASLYDAASVGFHISESCGPERKFLRITSFPSLDALQAYEDAWTEAMVSVRDARRESALTGRG